MEEETFSQSYPVAGRARLSLGNIRGKVDIRAAETDSISVTAVKHLDSGNARQTEIRMEQEHDGSVKIETRFEPILGWLNGSKPCKVDYQVTVPQHTALKLSLVSSDGTVEGLSEEVRINTVSGNVRLENITGPLNIHTVSGDIAARGLSGELDYDTVSGDLRFEQSNLPGIKGNSVSGSIYLETNLSEGPYKFHTVSGDVHLTLPQQSGCTVKTHSLSGRVRTNLPTQRTFSQGGSSHTELLGGGVELRFDSVSGDLKITCESMVGTNWTAEKAAVDEDLPNNHLQILEDIERGKITVEQGLALLSQ